MDYSNKEEINNIFGSDFLKYCDQHQVQLEKTKCGAFRVPNTKVLRNCLSHIDSYKRELNRDLGKVQNTKLVPDHIHHNHNYLRKKLQHKTAQKKRRKSERHRLKPTNIYLDNFYLHIYLYDVYPIAPIRKEVNYRGVYILNTANNGEEIFQQILMELEKEAPIHVSEFQPAAPLVSPLFERFRKCHTKFHYYSVLKHLNENDFSNRPRTEVSKDVLRRFLDIVLHKVVPMQLFGNAKNFARIKESIFYFVRMLRHEPFNLRILVEKLNIASITWLTAIRDEELRWLLLAKIVKWFFNGYLIKILRWQFFISTSSTNPPERQYSRRSDWQSLQKRYISRKIHKHELKKYFECDGWKPSVGVYKLLKKRTCFRPIFVPTYTIREKEETRVILKFLRQLYMTVYGTSTFHEEWRSFIQKTPDARDGKTYLVSCDVQDAFGSIVQERLYEIILQLCQHLPDTLTLKSYAIKSRYRLQERVEICSKQFFSHEQLELALPRGALFADGSLSCTTPVKKKWLLRRIRKYIFYQRVQLGKKMCIIGKGLVQGAMLSPILSDIYFNSMMHAKMKDFMTSGILTRYVDDILYVTRDRDLAIKFYESAKKGFPDYNCRFTQSKIQTNISDEECQTVYVKYLGYMIRSDSLEIYPQFRNEPRYVLSLYNKYDLSSIEFFEQKLCHLGALKLTKAVVDPLINNSRRAIIKVIREVGVYQAKRARALIFALFKNIAENAREIFKIIGRSNRKIARFVIRCRLIDGVAAGEFDAYIWNKKILQILWLSYKDVFRKYKRLRKHFPTIHLPKHSI